MAAPQTVLQLTSVHKKFKGVNALSNVDLELNAGEVHALLGENGAGKSTLIKVMTGVYSADAGKITLGGNRVAPGSPSEAQQLGIATVYQEVNLLPNLSVAHNLFLGREPYRFGSIHWKKVHQNAQRLLSRFKLDIDVREPLSSYSIAIQQLIAIARAVDYSAKVLILDEPTASLDASEVAVLFRILRELKDQGVAILFVTHFLDQVYELSDRITVLRGGHCIGTFLTRDLPRRDLIAHMLGKELQAAEQGRHCGPTESDEDAILQVRDVSAANGIEHISFQAKRGDAIGLAGLLGSGRSEICSMLFGLSGITAGTVQLAGANYAPSSPADAIGHGLALGPEDRKLEGIVDPLSVRENLIIAMQAQRGWWRPLPRSEQIALTNRAIGDLKIVCSDLEKPIGELSGGNQQKVILARWLITKPLILILDEPTRGIDIGAHADILKLIQNLCAEGMTLVVASSEVEELVAFSNKILVMRDRRLLTTIDSHAITENNVLAAMAGPA